MKLTSTLTLFLGVVLMSLMSCTTVLENPTPADRIAEEETSLCTHTAVVKENRCGLYLDVENAKDIFVRDTKGVDLVVGMTLNIGYKLSNNYSTSTPGEGGGSCGDQNHVDSDPNHARNCMAMSGIQEATIRCIEVISGDDGSTD